jgi:hypothetical protein
VNSIVVPRTNPDDLLSIDQQKQIDELQKEMGMM